MYKDIKHGFPLGGLQKCFVDPCFVLLYVINGLEAHTKRGHAVTGCRWGGAA